jgi:DNA-binding transcriptional regulator YiaG
MYIKPGSKYAPLLDYLHSRAHEGSEEVVLTFAQIEKLLSTTLPEGARIERGWWGNRTTGSSQAAAWLEAGYKVKTVSLEQRKVTFEARDRKQSYVVRRDGNTVLWNNDMIKSLRAYLDMTQAQFAAHLGVRQQTISEWENGIYEPTRATDKHLTLVAEQAGFDYDQE